MKIIIHNYFLSKKTVLHLEKDSTRLLYNKTLLDLFVV
jgi:hypothetical protein